MTTKKAYLCLMLGAFIISFAPIFAKLVQTGGDGRQAMGPTASAFYRALIGAIFLSFVVLYQKKSLFKVSKKVVFFLCIGGLFFSTDLAAWHRCIILVGPGLAALLASFQVFILTIVGFLFLKEKPSLLQWLSIPLALFGLSLIVGIDTSKLDEGYKLGLLLGFITACFYAGYVLSLRGANKAEIASKESKNDPIRIMALVSLVTAIFLFLYSISFGESFAVGRPINWLWLLLLGVFCQAIAWVFISLSLPYVTAAHVGMIILLQPIFAFVWDILIFDRGITKLELIGATIAIVAIYLGSTQQPTSKISKTSEPSVET